MVWRNSSLVAVEEVGGGAAVRWCSEAVVAPPRPWMGGGQSRRGQSQREDG
jgi:hypothetical protein